MGRGRRETTGKEEEEEDWYEALIESDAVGERMVMCITKMSRYTRAWEDR